VLHPSGEKNQSLSLEKAQVNPNAYAVPFCVLYRNCRDAEYHHSVSPYAVAHQNYEPASIFAYQQGRPAAPLLLCDLHSRAYLRPFFSTASTHQVFDWQRPSSVSHLTEVQQHRSRSLGLPDSVTASWRGQSSADYYQ